MRTLLITRAPSSAQRSRKATRLGAGIVPLSVVCIVEALARKARNPGDHNGGEKCLRGEREGNLELIRAQTVEGAAKLKK
jgi:hypothetical protein